MFKNGTKTPIVCRFSTALGEKGSADTVRDARGMAVKYYTSDGIWDLIGFSTPGSPARDPMQFESFVHAMKRNPCTNLQDPDMFWDYVTMQEEMAHATLFFFCDGGIPKCYRHMNTFSLNTFKLVNELREYWYCRFHYITNQGFEYLTTQEAATIRAMDPDFCTRDLYNAIGNGNYPSWTLYIQIMTEDDVKKLSFDAFDSTKVWPEKRFPLIKVGTLTFNRNPKNYFEDVEQAAFNPGNLVPGIQSSPDKVLQARIFAYGDAQRYRLGANHLQLPVNCPFGGGVKNFQRDGYMDVIYPGAGPNYYPNSFNGPVECERARKLEIPYSICGEACRKSTANDDNFSQVIEYWKTFTDDHKQRTIGNIALYLSYTSKPLQDRAIKFWAKVSLEISEELKKIFGRK